MRPEDHLAIVASAFPTLTRRQLAQCTVLEGDALRSLSQVARDHNTSFFAAVARAVIAAAPTVTLVDSFPGLQKLVDAVVLRGTFDSRTDLALQQLGEGGAYTWGDIAAQTPSHLRALFHIGEKSLSELVGVVARASVLFPDALGHAPVSRAGLSPGPEATSSRSPRAAPDVLGPDDPSAASRPTGVGRPKEPTSLGWTERLREFEEALGDERDRAIFWASIDVDPPPHVSMAPEFGLSSERVRQLRARVEEAAGVALSRTRLAAFQVLADDLGARLGLGFPELAPWARAAVDTSTKVVDAEWRSRLQRLLLWLAGPYRRTGIGWLARGPLPGRGEAFSEATDDSPRVDIKRVETNLIGAGLVPEAVDDWLRQVAGLRRISEGFYVWEGSVGDKAFAVLSAWDRPATVAELVEAIGEGHGERTTRGRLLSDARFMRVDRARIGLRGWLEDEYLGTVEELARELEARGGNCDVGDLVMTVAHRFDLTVGSVQAHTRAPRFVVEGTRARFRRRDEPYRPRHGLAEAPHCYLLGHHECSYRLEVDAQALRGSSRTIPDGLGAWLGVLPEAQRDFFDGTEVLRVFWWENSISGPLLGSVRKIVARLGGAKGDHLLLRFNRDRSSFSASLAKPHDLADATPEAQVKALTGLSGDRPIVDAVADAVGVTTSALEYHIRSRREYDLLAIISARQGRRAAPTPDGP